MRSGCPHTRLCSAPRDHGYCCNTCKRDEGTHTWNCTGYEDVQQAIAQQPGCGRSGCPHTRRWGSPRDHGYCCNACKRDEGTHTWNCTGYDYGQPLAPLATPSTWQTTLHSSGGERGFRPALPRANDVSVLQYIRDLTARHGLQLRGAPEDAWKRFEDRYTSAFMPHAQATHRRRLCLVPHAQDSIPEYFVNQHVDVALKGVDGKCRRLYHLGEVTGVDECVQAVVASQTATAECLRVAFEWIEEEDLNSFSFVCHGATHRSVACCFLMAALAYPHARVHLTTNRTRRAAEFAGLS